MKLKRVLFSLIFLLLGSSILIADQTQAPSSVLSGFQKPGHLYLFGQGTRDGRMFDYSVRVEEITKIPEWLPEKSDPPLSLSAAISIAKKTVHADHPKFQSFGLSKLDIMPVPSSGSSKKWFYVISFYPVVEEVALYESEITVVVLMSGFVVKPVENEKYKSSKSLEHRVPPEELLKDLSSVGSGKGDSTAVESPDGMFFLVRREKEVCAIRFHESERWDQKKYDAYYQPNGGGSFTEKNVVSTSGLVYENYDMKPGTNEIIDKGSQLFVFCGPFRVEWSAGNWVYWRGLTSGISDFQIASTSWSKLEEIDVSSKSLQWHGIK